MSAIAAIDRGASRGQARLRREAAELEAAIALVAARSQYRIVLCGLRYGGQLAAARAAEAAAAGVRLEPVRRDQSTFDIRVCRA